MLFHHPDIGADSKVIKEIVRLYTALTVNAKQMLIDDLISDTGRKDNCDYESTKKQEEEQKQHIALVTSTNDNLN